MRRNPDAKPFQDIFDPNNLIQRANRLQRLSRTLSFPIQGVFSVNDISEHCNEEFGIAFPRTKSDSSLSEVVFDTSAFDFPCISWSSQTSEPLGMDFQHFPTPECPTLTS